MLTARAMFMDSLEKWLHAARAGEMVRAEQHARDMVRNGELLVIHPEFIRAFREKYPDTEPRYALLMLAEFLVCATDRPERTLREWTRQAAEAPPT